MTSVFHFLLSHKGDRPFCVTRKMRKISIVGPDDKVALVKELVMAIPGMEIIEVKDVDSIEEFQRKPPMERLDFAIRRVDNTIGTFPFVRFTSAIDTF